MTRAAPHPAVSAPVSAPLPARLACVLAALLVLAGCGGESRADGVQRLSFAPAPGPAVPAPRVVARLEPAAESETWELLLGVPSEPPAGSDPARADDFLHLAPETFGTPVRVLREGRFVLDEIQRLRLTLDTTGNTLVSAVLLRGDTPVAGSEPVSSTHLTGVGVIELDLPRAPAGLVADALVLHFGSTPRQVRLARVELLEVPDAARVPGPDEPARLVESGGEARRAVGLVAGTPRTLSFEAPDQGVLRLGYALPEGARPAGALHLELALTAGESAPTVTMHDLVRPVPGAPAWRNLELPLRVEAGTPVTVAVHLMGAPAGAAACLLAEPVVAPAAPPPRPSVLLVTTDTHRGDHLGAARSPVSVRTPVLDALAERGVLYEDCFAPANYTNPSHIALMTGLHPRDVGILTNKQPVTDAAATLAERFAAAGYRTWAAVSAHHLGPHVSGLGQGFDRMTWPTLPERPSPETLAVVDRWLREPDPRPVFLWMHTFDAHRPYDPPEGAVDAYYTPGQAPDPGWPQPGPDEALPPEMAGVPDADYPRAQYRALVTFLDEQLGRVVDHPRFADGVVAVVGDHGESLGEHGIWFEHAELYPDTLHVPLVLAWPDAPAGARVDTPVSPLDLGRTLLDLAGLEGADFPGRRLAGAAGDADDGAGRAAPRFALSSHGSSASVTADGLHLVLHLRPGHAVYEHHQVELYDLRADPGCLDDLVDTRAEDARRLRQLLVGWLADAPAEGLRGGAVVDPSVLADFEALGYVDGGAGGGPLWQEDDCDSCRRFQP